MPGTLDLGQVVGEAGPGIPAGGNDGQVLVKDGSGNYSGRWETRPKTFNGVLPDANGDFKVTEVQNARQLVSDDARQSTGEYIMRTTGGESSLSDGDAWLVRIHGRRVHNGYVPESIVMTVTPAQREEGEYAITAEIDEDTFKSYVSVSGTTTLTYTTGWSASPALYGVTVTGTPVSGDVIQIVYTKEERGTIVVSNPSAFASTGWNLYNHTNGYARVLKYSGTRGFLVGGNYTLLQFSETLEGTKTEITVTDGAFTIEKDGYVWVTGGDNSTTYILMTWSDWTAGYDGDWEAYSESTVSLSSIMSSYFPYGMMQVGVIADVIDVAMKQAISYIERLAYSASNLNNAEQSGRPYECDENYIYLVREEPVVNAITLDGQHTACDHGMEIVKGTGVAVMVETLYGENLKEMLQHDIPNQLAAQNEAIQQIATVITGTTNNSGHAISANEYFIADGAKYKASQTIDTGATWAGKCTSVSDHDLINALNSKIATQDIGTFSSLADLESALVELNSNMATYQFKNVKFETSSAFGVFGATTYKGTVSRISSGRMYCEFHKSSGTVDGPVIGKYNVSWTWDKFGLDSKIADIANTTQIDDTSTKLASLITSAQSPRGNIKIFNCRGVLAADMPQSANKYGVGFVLDSTYYKEAFYYADDHKLYIGKKKYDDESFVWYTVQMTAVS